MLDLARATVTALIAGMLFVGAARADDPRIHHVLKADDYLRITGCDGYGGRDALESAIQFLVFADSPTIHHNNRNIDYPRRHALPMFRELLQHNTAADSALDPRCLTPGLRRMALALRLLDPEGRFTDKAILPPTYVYTADVASTKAPLAEAYTVMTRMAFIEKTGCKVSLSSYDHLRLAFEALVLWKGEEARAAKSMTAFLDDLVDSRPTPDGRVDQRCMIPAIARIAADLNLLDDDGRYRSRR